MKKKLLITLTLAAISTSAYAEGKKIGVLWFKKSGMAERVAKGMLEKLKTDAPDLQIESRPNLPSDKVAAPIYQKFQEEKDAVVFLRSAGAKYAKANPSKRPVFIGASNDPKQLGVIDNPVAPEGNITGVTYYLPAKQKLAAFKHIFPNVKKICLMVEKGHASTPIEQSETQQACKEMGLEYTEAVCTSKVDVLKQAKRVAPAVDLIITGNQALLIDNSAKVVSMSPTTPVVSYSEKPIKQGGAICGLVADDVKLGAMLAESIIDVLVKGKKISEVPVKRDPNPRLLFNEKVAAKYGAVLPDALRNSTELIK